jgi:hypothetical protein
MTRLWVSPSTKKCLYEFDYLPTSCCLHRNLTTTTLAPALAILQWLGVSRTSPSIAHRCACNPQNSTFGDSLE